MSTALDTVKDRIARLEAATIGPRSAPGGGTRLNLEQVDIQPIVEVLKALVKELEDIEARIKS
jgi:hypothetical protein